MSRLLFWSFDDASASAASSDSKYARMMMALLPPGRVWRFVSSMLEKLFLACADELERLEQRALVLLDESVPSLANELLPEYERELELDGTGATEERQAAVVARHIADQGFRPVDLQSTLAPLLGLDAADVVVLERTHAQAVAMGDDREIYVFFIYRDPTLPGSYQIASAQALLDTISHSHTRGYVIESGAGGSVARYSDPNTLRSRDLYG